MIKTFEVQPHLKVRINQDIPGLRKKNTPFARKPNNRIWWHSFTSYERNGVLNIGLSRNWTRIAFPIIPIFFAVYFFNPIIHGTTYINYYHNYQWEGVYYKFATTRMPYSDATITRLA